MINDLLNSLKNSKCDICEHIDVLIEYAKECKHITELGTRHGVSTLAFISSNPDFFITCDIYKDEALINLLTFYSNQNNINFTFINEDDLKINIDETDLLFIDTYHTYLQLSKELYLHGNKSKRFIIFHDTESYGNIGEDGNYPGLLTAIDDFIKNNEHWKIKEKFINNNGLLILERFYNEI